MRSSVELGGMLVLMLLLLPPLLLLMSLQVCLLVVQRCADARLCWRVVLKLLPLRRGGCWWWLVLEGVKSESARGKAINRSGPVCDLAWPLCELAWPVCDLAWPLVV